MLKRLLYIVLFVFLAFNFNDSKADTNSNQDNKPKQKYRIVKNGDAYTTIKEGDILPPHLKTSTQYVAPVSALFNGPFIVDASTDITATFTPTGGTTIYDLSSNGSPMHIIQDPNDPDKIHIVLMTAPPGDPAFTNRRCEYYYSSNRGTTWSNITQVPTAIRSGFPMITLLSNGNALITNHSNAGGGPTRGQVFVDAFPGLGSFVTLDPGTGPPSALIWPRVIATSSVTETNKFVMVASNQTDTTAMSVSTSLTTSTFSSWQYINSDQAETYALARGDNGNIGIIFIDNETNNPSEQADLFFMESTDGGSTFPTPTKIWDTDFTGDSLGPIRGISLVYQGNIPKVSFETGRISPPTSFVPGAASKIRFWSPSLPGADPNKSIVIADTNNVPFNAPVATGVNDVYFPMCRPVIGVSKDGTGLFVSFINASVNSGGAVDTTAFHDVYIMASGDNGTSWTTPTKINPDTPIRDWTYPSMSPVNDNDASFYYVNMVMLSDSVPGSFVNGANNGESLAQQMYVRVKINRNKVGINNIGSTVPDAYSLEQNYPNPFNPSTSIRFNIPKASNVTLKVYDMTGREVATLINNQIISAGIKEYSFNASTLSSGIYFYTLEGEGFRATKKMILLK